MDMEQRPHILQTGTAAPATISQARGRSLFHGQTEAGRTNSVIVYTDGTPQGNATASAILQTADADFGATQAAFGGIALPSGQEGDDQTVPRTALPVQVLMDPQAGGAYHFGCNATDIYVEPDPQLANGFFVAELVEIFESAINNGWDCGQTNGEALSRVLAGERNANLGPLFVQTAQSWWADGAQDYVNSNTADDTNQDANGCGTLFLYYLHSQLNFDWPTIVTTGGSSLGDTYQRLTNQDPVGGFGAFVSLLSTLDMGGSLNLPASGNPFPISSAGEAPGVGQGAGQGVPVGAGAGAFGGYNPGGYNPGGYNPSGDYPPFGDPGVATDDNAQGAMTGDAGALGGVTPGAATAGASAGDTTAPSDGEWEAVAIEEAYAVPGAPAAGDLQSAAPYEVQDEVAVEVVPWPQQESAPVAPSVSPSAPPPMPVPATSAPQRADDLRRTGPIEPRELDAPAAPTRRRSEVIETMIAVLVILIVLVALGLVMVLFSSGLVHL